MSAILMPQDQLNMDEWIDLLWMQDMDMGFSRDIFDPVKQQEHQKQQELLRQQELEKEKELERLEEMMYMTDPETGERIPIDSPLAQFYQQPAQPAKVEMEISAQVAEEFSLDELESLLNPDMEVEPLNGLDYTPLPAACPRVNEEETDIKQEPEFEDVWGISVDSPPNPDDFDDLMYGPQQFKPYYNAQPEADDFNSPFSVGSSFSSFGSGSPLSLHASDSKLTPPSFWDTVEPEMMDLHSVTTPDVKPKLPKTELDFENDMMLEVKPPVDKQFELLMRRGRSKDVERARLLGIPYSVSDIIDLPVEDFNDLLKTEQLTDEQLAVVRDIRRRGKNKIAAQNCRKKKISELSDLEIEIEELKKKKDALISDKMTHTHSLLEVHSLAEQTQAELLCALRDGTGKPYDPSLYMVNVTEGGKLFVIPRQYI